MQEQPDDTKERKKKDESKLGDLEDEDSLLLEDEEKEKARLRTRGPYRKSSRVGL
jgi:hypothetical protein